MNKTLCNYNYNQASKVLAYFVLIYNEIAVISDAINKRIKFEINGRYSHNEP